VSAPSAVRSAARGASPSLPFIVLGLAWLSAFSARTATLTVGPMLPLLQADLHLTFAESGLLFSIPVLMMGLFSIPSGLVIARLGVRWTLLISLTLLGAGGALRATAAGVGPLFAFTALTGAGIGLLQPTLPRLVKDWFHERTGTATAVYSSGFVMGAVVATGITVPVLLPLSGSLTWRGPFLVWSGLVWLSLAAWLLVRGQERRGAESLAPFARVFRNRLCWLLAFVFLSQSIIYYVLNSWLTSFYQSYGWTLTAAASSLVFLSVGSVVGGFGGPVLSDRVGRRPVMRWSAVLTIIGLAGLLLRPLELYWLWALLVGGFTAVLFTIGFVIPVDVAKPAEVGAFTGLMLAVGYGGVVVGPTAIGWLRDVTGSNLYGLLALLSIAVVQLWLVWLVPETRPARG
jgi:MFS transporter, CP family, cyanate transporter